MSSLQLPKGITGFVPTLSSNKALIRNESRDSLSDSRSFRGVQYEASRGRKRISARQQREEESEGESVCAEVRENYDEFNLVFGPHARG